MRGRGMGAVALDGRVGRKRKYKLFLFALDSQIAKVLNEKTFLFSSFSFFFHPSFCRLLNLSK